jgi:glycosyltransferase involved in cell wall biosynthesis
MNSLPDIAQPTHADSVPGRAAHARPALPGVATAIRPAVREVSVIVPSKDGRETIQRALRSLVTSADYICEVFVVFSNSPRQYIESCQSLASQYAGHFPIRLMDSGSASNGSIARNFPLPFAKGRYIAFLDDDDEWFDDKLSAYFRHIGDKGLDGDFVLFSTVIACSEDMTWQRPYPSRAYCDEPIADFILGHGGGAQTSSILLPTLLARCTPFDATLPRHQDYDFCMRLAEQGARFHHLNEPMSYWYQRGSAAAKGGTFEFCSGWLLANRHRLSENAFASYVGKELFGTARASRNWRPLGRFMASHMTLRERQRVVAGLLSRAMALGWQRLAGWLANGRLKHRGASGAARSAG